MYQKLTNITGGRTGACKRVLVSQTDGRRPVARPEAKIGGRVESDRGKGTELEPSASRAKWRKIVEAAMIPNGL